MAIVVGYFDTEDAATAAMDQLMKMPGFDEVETRVYSRGSSENMGPGMVVGGFPNNMGTTGSGGLTNNNMAPVPVTGWGDSGWLDDLGSEERGYFTDAMSSGRGVLAMARVDDNERAGEIRRLFSQLGARTYAEKE